MFVGAPHYAALAHLTLGCAVWLEREGSLFLFLPNPPSSKTNISAKHNKSQIETFNVKCGLRMNKYRLSASPSGSLQTTPEQLSNGFEN